MYLVILSWPLFSSDITDAKVWPDQEIVIPLSTRRMVPVVMRLSSDAR